MSTETLNEFVAATAERFGIPGAAVGVLTDGRAHFACHGVTSRDNPLPVDSDTLFLLGSVTKTYTATALLRLAGPDDPVSRYLPAAGLPGVTVRHLLNHTAGLGWGLIGDFGEGDDALARYVAALGDLERVAAPGARASYSQAGYNVAGRIIEVITGQTYEDAVRSLVLEPLGLGHSFFARDDVMTRRFSVGHNRAPDGSLSIARLWRRSRGDNPGGGLVSSVADQLRWARHHLSAAPSTDGSISAEQRMTEPTVRLRGSNLGDAIGLGWFLRDVGGVRLVGHGGSANGQFTDLLTVPSRGFAVVSMSNAGPDGIPFNQAVLRWALRDCTGIEDRDPVPLPFDPGSAAEVQGAYENDVMTLTIGGTGAGLRLEVLMKPAIRAASDRELPPDHAPFDLGLLPGDEYVLTSGAFRGQRGYFTRDDAGTVTGVDLAGRLFGRAGASR
jgi:CubicO group peptidase (beta-lactamase class C family)